MLRKPLLTTHEVAELLKIKEATVRRWIRDGELPAVSLGRDWRVAVIQLEEFLKLRVTGAPSMTGGAVRDGESAASSADLAAPPPGSSKGRGRKPSKLAGSLNQS